MPMIAFLTKSGRDRWLTWITPSYVSRDFLESYDVDTGVMRIIHRSEEEEGCMWLTLEALAAGNSHTVISSLGKLIDKEFRQLELAAFEGKCQGLLLRTR